MRYTHQGTAIDLLFKVGITLALPAALIGFLNALLIRDTLLALMAAVVALIGMSFTGIAMVASTWLEK